MDNIVTSASAISVPGRPATSFSFSIVIPSGLGLMVSPEHLLPPFFLRQYFELLSSTLVLAVLTALIETLRLFFDCLEGRRGIAPFQLCWSSVRHDLARQFRKP